MKKLSLTLLICFTGLWQTASAQVSKNDFLYSRYTFGVGGGLTTLKGDVPIYKISGGGKLSFDYNFSPYLSVGLEGQYGHIMEGKKENIPAGGLYDESSFGGININARLAVGEIFQKKSAIGIVNIAKRIYLGSGLGYVRSHVIEVSRGPQNLGGNTNSGVFAVPTNVGLDVPLKKNEEGRPKIMLNFNYQFNFVLSDDLDAFNYTSAYNHANDAYSLFSLGLKFSLGKGSDDMHK